MTSPDSEQITDEALASSISDDGRLSSEAFSGDDEGIVEAGIPPTTNDPSDNELDEEAFSVDDFDADMSIDDNADQGPVVPDVKNQSAEILHDEGGTPATQESNDSPPSVETSSPDQLLQQSQKQSAELPNGQVAEFRQTLSALSRQLEIDRLTFLYQQLQADGNELPPLDRIASDIKGESALHPLGDQDIYSKRPLARLQGWISGLSFGVGRRAKKFSR